MKIRNIIAAAVSAVMFFTAAGCAARTPDKTSRQEESSVSSISSAAAESKEEITASKSSSKISKTDCSMFRRVCCIGDSFTAGYTLDSSGFATETNEDLAWPHYMSEMTGCEYINCGKSGATAESWLYTPRGLPKAKETGKVDAYIIGLGLNDASDSPGMHLDVGTADDIGSDKTSFYGCMSRIVREVHDISPDAYIFMQTMPDGENGGYDAERYDPYNDAIRDICAEYEKDYNTRLLDLEKYKDRYLNDKVLLDNAVAGHYYPEGYREFAVLLYDIWNEYLREHSDESDDSELS